MDRYPVQRNLPRIEKIHCLRISSEGDQAGMSNMKLTRVANIFPCIFHCVQLEVQTKFSFLTVHNTGACRISIEISAFFSVQKLMIVETSLCTYQFRGQRVFQCRISTGELVKVQRQATLTLRTGNTCTAMKLISTENEMRVLLFQAKMNWKNGHKVRYTDGAVLNSDKENSLERLFISFILLISS